MGKQRIPPPIRPCIKCGKIRSDGRTHDIYRFVCCGCANPTLGPWRPDCTYRSSVKKILHRQGGIAPFPPCSQLLALYRPSPSGKTSFSGSSTASRLPLFRPSSSTEIAAAVNTPATPASMPPINVHLLFMVIFLFSCAISGGGIFPAFCSSAVLNRLIVPIFLDDLQHRNSNRYPCQWVHTASLGISSAEYAAGCG